MTKLELLTKLDQMLMERLVKEEEYVENGDGIGEDWSEGYMDGLEFAMACITDMKNEVA